MRYFITFTCLLLIVCAACSFLPINGETEIYDNTVRLHIIANSDDEEDQNIKLAVRDAVLSKMDEIIKNAENAGEASRLLSENVEVIRSYVEDTLENMNSKTDVTVLICNEYYPTREYEDFRLPAGTYTSLQIRLGNAEGHNWWCVLYPGVCTSAASVKDSLMKTGFTSDEIRILTDGESPKYKLKFKILEFFEESFSG